MPAHVDIYCKNSIARVTADELRRELDDADLMTLAECLDLPGGEEAAVREMRPHLKVSGGDGAEAKAHVRELVEEWLPEADDEGARAVLKHLGECNEIVYIEMGLDDSNHLGATLAEVIAFHLAERGNGLVYFYSRDWASPKDRGENLWTTE